MNIFKKVIKAILPYFNEYIKIPKFKRTYYEFLKFKFGFTNIYWPKADTCLVGNPSKIYVGINSFIGRECSYIQGQGGIYVGNYVECGPNIGIVSANHDLYDQRKSHNKPVIIGDYSWIGMNSVITAGVELGTRTIVGAGSVVTKSFPEGFCVIAGNPAKIIKYLDKDKFVPWRYKEEFYGYIPKEKFEKVRKKYIAI